MEILEGTLTHIRFQRDAFLIGMLQFGKRNVAILGNILNPEIGCEYKLFGDFSKDPKWGSQFKFNSYETVVPRTTDGIYRYIVRMTKWVGPAIGQKLIDRYGEDTLDVLRNEPQRVADEIPGITLARAIEIQGFIQKNQMIEAALIELENLLGGQGLKGSLPMDLVVKWGADAPARIKADPYCLIEVDGIGFPSADRIATSKFSIPPDAPRRKVACVKHIMRDNWISGNIWMAERQLLNSALVLIGTSVQVEVNDMVSGQILVRDGDFIARVSDAADEQFIARKIKEMIIVKKEEDIRRFGPHRRAVRM